MLAVAHGAGDHGRPRMVRRTRRVHGRRVAVSLLDLVVQVGLAVFGLVLLFDWTALTNDIDLGIEADLELAGVRAPDRDDRLHRPREGGQPGRAWPRIPRRPCPTASARRCSPSSWSTRRSPPRPSRRFRSHRRPGAPAGYSSELTTTLAGRADARPGHAVGNEWGSAAGRSRAAARRRRDGHADPAAGDHDQLLGRARLSMAMGERLAAAGRFAKRSRRSLQPPAALLGVGGCWRRRS